MYRRDSTKHRNLSGPVFVGILTSPCDVFEIHATRAELQTGARSRLESVKQGKGDLNTAMFKEFSAVLLRVKLSYSICHQKGVLLALNKPRLLILCDLLHQENKHGKYLFFSLAETS